MSDKKDTITLVTSDEETYTVQKKVAERSNLIKQMIEGESQLTSLPKLTPDLAGPSDEAIPLPNVSSSVLVKVLEYCDHHQNDPLPPSDSNDADDARRKATEISEWDAKFIQVS